MADRDEFQTALLHIAYMTHQTAEVRELVEECYDTSVLTKVVEEAEDHGIECQVLRHLTPNTTTARANNRDVSILVTCFTNRSLNGVDVHDALKQCSAEHLADFIMQQLGWQPRKERRRPKI